MTFSLLCSLGVYLGIVKISPVITCYHQKLSHVSEKLEHLYAGTTSARSIWSLCIGAVGEFQQTSI